MAQDKTGARIGRGPESPVRRDLLCSLLTFYCLTLLPRAVVAAAPNDAKGAFRAVSEFLTGRRALRGGLEGDIFQALTAIDPNFPGLVSQLLAVINERRLQVSQLQAVLDAGFPELAPLPRQIASGWFLGVVGSGFEARSVAYEHALNAEIVEDVLEPQGFCLGNPGVWAEPPLS
ncbi:sorbitol dehydrogenase family protein [Pseudomonas sp. MOB-449]|nr:sorbitol dehydrogenase family protein [Pseudomonas sp. MOB-449]